jgi:alginate O-acetyltransferase complex protein AlgI
MLFCSKEFLFIFLPIFLVIYYLVPVKFKNIILFVGSIVFYAVGELKYVPLIISSLVVNYIVAIFIEGCKIQNRLEGIDDNSKKNIFMIVALLYDFGILFVFKYFTFFTGIKSSLTLPLGISFYTFQIVSYVIDVYKDKIRAEKNIINLGVYLMMFPQLIAGPIVIYSDIARQVRRRSYSLEKFEDGIKVFTLGLGAKMIIANMLGSCWTTAQMYGIEGMSTPMAWVAMFAYTFQIYFDFYGYSLMAIGLGLMLGFTLPKNFDNPYMSRSATEFWRRWHITLGSWFREYVYIPLGGNRKGQVRTIFNTFVVWALTGLWHGASWNFVLWGIIFFVLLTIEKSGFENILDRYKVLSHIYAMLIIPMSWIVFALENLSDIGLYFKRLFPIFGSSDVAFINTNDYKTALIQYGIFFLLAIVFSFEFPQKIYHKYKKTFVVNIVIIIIFWLSVYRIMTSASNPFLYFRF